MTRKTAAAAVLAWLALASTGVARHAEPDVPPGDPGPLLAALQAAWRARDAEAYLASGASATRRRGGEERTFLFQRWSGNEAVLTVETPLAAAWQAPPRDRLRPGLHGDRAAGRVEQMLYTLEHGPEGWVVVDREEVGDIDGLVHLSLGPQGFRAAGMTMRLEDFEMTWTRGTLFTSPVGVGPTVLVFVGEGVVRFRPRVGDGAEPAAPVRRPAGARGERPLRVRPHPPRRLPPRVVAGTAGARPGGRPAPRRRAADVPRAGRGGLRARHRAAPLAVVADPRPGRRAGGFPGQARRAHLRAQPTPTPRASRCSTGAAAGRSPSTRRKAATTSYNEDDELASDVLHHDLNVRFDAGPVGSWPERTPCASACARAASTVRLRLDESLRVESIRSPQGGDHLFFRVRHQDSLMVSLGPLAGPRGRDLAHRPLLRRPPPGAAGAGGAAGGGRAFRRRGARRRVRHRARARLLEPDGLVSRRERRATTRPRPSASTCPPDRWRSRGGRSRRRARRAGARCSSTGRSGPESTSPWSSAG